MQYEVIWITIFVMGMLGLLFDVTIRKIIDKTGAFEFIDDIPAGTDIYVEGG